MAVVLFDTHGACRLVRLDGPSLRIGRGEDNEVVLSDGAASRGHARILTGAEGVEIRDEGSGNGTFVDGRRISRARLVPGHLLRIGDTLGQVLTLPESWTPAEGGGPMVGGATLTPVRRQLALVGPTTLPVLILGETGTGKEVAARLLHEASGRSGPFIAVNCAALPEQLVESELFGHVRGAFTDARQSRKGLFVAAHGGTLFLDEIGDVPLTAQAKLLRALEDGQVRPVGSESAHKVEVRVVSATNRDLEAQIQARTFRADLLARLAAVEVRLPALRSRPCDLPALTEFLLRRAGRSGLVLAADALEALALHDWPQNVRELDNVLRAAALSAQAGVIERSHLPARFLPAQVVSETPRPALAHREQLEAALRAHHGNVRQVSQRLGIGRGHLYRLMERWQLQPDAFRKAGTGIAHPGDDRTDHD